MANIVVVCPDLPYPPNSGGNVKSYFLMEHLCANHDVALVSVTKGGNEKHIPAMREALPLTAVITEPVNKPRSMMNFARSILGRQTLNEFRTWTPALGPRAEALFGSADAIVVDHLEVMQYVPKQHWLKTVFHTHNAEHVLWQRKSEISTSLPEKLGAGLEAKRIARKEAEYCNGVAATLAAPADQTALETGGATSASFFRTYHLGDDSKLDLPDVQWTDTDAMVFYMGTLSWEPNIDGLERFVTETWPAVLAANPTARFVIGGANPPPSLMEKVGQTANIDVVGFVDDPEEYFTRARVVVAPLRFGSGMKLKVLEALTRGTPVVTTPIGVESIDAVDRLHLMVSPTIADMAPAVTELLTDESLWTSLRDNSRTLVRNRYTWDVVRADFDRALAAVTG